ncbi:AraC family transcriptional regulator [Arthrobacter sp. B2a2-09]|uniref:AraC family transcriptional regulator n=1 Tax=Arthrobacter sp. B2a2-09 TaxID=2952822 RepID=UPI0022CD96AC|nr:AraC family transcriptional regulator [Arthrobacter sp. B2a2-09]MCZ9880969.1 AraC family transcriptional regulator [Arthrobacter sp. B2a2-09]
MIEVPALPLAIPDGFPGQRMFVLPRPRVREALRQPGTAHLVVTDCGYFPKAQSHGRVRRTPIPQAVIIVCTRGSGWCQTEGGRFTVKAGQVIILPPGQPHAYGADTADPWTLWWMHVAGQDLPEFLTAAGMTPQAPVRELSDIYRIVALLTEVIHWMERDSTAASLLAAAGAAWHLMALLASDRTTSDRGGVAVDQATEYLRTHLGEATTVAGLAAMARLSTSHFAAQFKERTGYPVLQYQTQLRMARARELLDTTNQSIASVAHSVGYPDSYYFSRKFKEVHGVTPLRYRKEHKG